MILALKSWFPFPTLQSHVAHFHLVFKQPFLYSLELKSFLSHILFNYIFQYVAPACLLDKHSYIWYNSIRNRLYWKANTVSYGQQDRHFRDFILKDPLRKALGKRWWLLNPTSIPNFFLSSCIPARSGTVMQFWIIGMSEILKNESSRKALVFPKKRNMLSSSASLLSALPLAVCQERGCNH